MSFIVAAFYTKNTFYEDEARELIETAKLFNLKYDVRAYDSRGNWVRNASIKPEFVYQMLLEHKKEDVLYVDVDARFRQYPSLYDNFDGDLGLHYLSKNKDQSELLSGTIFFKNNDPVRKLVKFWVEEQQNKPDVWDQRVLDEVIKNCAGKLGIKVVNTPPQYTRIFDSKHQNCAPVIEHMQASRRARRKGLTRKGTLGYAFVYFGQSIARRLRHILNKGK
ncbi:MAG: putative nucleotide-diphospho-sugar transferase [Bacillota bacterium]